jgi:hypothetical protein
MFNNVISLERSKSFQYKHNHLESLMTKRVRKTTKSPEDYRSQEDYKRHKEPQDYKGSRKPRNPGSPQESGSPQDSKKTAKSQESRIPRVWKTGIIQESKPKRITPNTTIFPPARGGKKEKGKRDSSLKSLVKFSDDSSLLKLHP